MNIIVLVFRRCILARWSPGGEWPGGYTAHQGTDGHVAGPTETSYGRQVSSFLKVAQLLNSSECVIVSIHVWPVL